MPKAPNANAAESRLQKQVADLQNELRAAQQALKVMQAQQASAIQQAADIGYELGCLDMEEREIHRADAIAEAVAKFEQARKSPRAASVAKAAKQAASAAAASQNARAKSAAASANAKARARRAKAQPQADAQPVASVADHADVMN